MVSILLRRLDDALGVADVRLRLDRAFRLGQVSKCEDIARGLRTELTCGHPKRLTAPAFASAQRARMFAFGPAVPEVARPNGGGALRGMAKRPGAYPATEPAASKWRCLCPKDVLLWGRHLILRKDPRAVQGVSVLAGRCRPRRYRAAPTRLYLPTVRAGAADVFEPSGENDLVPSFDVQPDGQPTQRHDKYKQWIVDRFRSRNDYFSAGIKWQYTAVALRYVKRMLYANLAPGRLDCGNRFKPLPWAVAIWEDDMHLHYPEPSVQAIVSGRVPTQHV